MRYLICCFSFLILTSSSSVVSHEVPLRALHGFKLQSLTLTHTDFRHEGVFSYGGGLQKGDRIRVVYGRNGDSVFLYEYDTLVSAFKAHNYAVWGEVKTYDRKGNLVLREYLEDSIDVNDPRASGYHGVFKAIKHGMSESFFSDGKPGSMTWYRHGRNDTFEKIWFDNGRLYNYKHKDTMLYFYENGKRESASCFTQKGKARYYVIYQYWPNGKLKSESYYVNEDKLIPVHVWKEYDEKGKLIKQVSKKNEPYGVEMPPPMLIERAEFIECNLEERIKYGLIDVMKSSSIHMAGVYLVKFSLNRQFAELISVDGPEKYQMEALLKNMFRELSCYSMSHNGSRGMDFYTMEFSVSE